MAQPVVEADERDKAAEAVQRSFRGLAARRAAAATVAELGASRLAAANTAAVQVQAAARRRLARRKREQAYWDYAYKLLREEAVEKVQRSMRVAIARRARDAERARRKHQAAEQAAQASIAARHAVAARTLQRGFRRRWRVRGKKMTSNVSKTRALFKHLQSTTAATEELNPFSEAYVGAEEHRKRISAEVGALRRYGNPNKAARDRALPAQVATLLNVLRLVDAINWILQVRTRMALCACACAHGRLRTVAIA